MKPDLLTQLPRHKRSNPPQATDCPAGLKVELPANKLSHLIIDTTRLRHNLATLRRVAPNAAMCAMVKKNAYGLGMMPTARLATEPGATGVKVDMLGVYGVDEAEQLVAGGIKTPILLMAPIHHTDRASPLYRHFSAGMLHPCIQEPSQLPALDQCARRIGVKLPVHLYLDTGMSRSGLTIEQFATAVKDMSRYRYLHLAGIYSHLATASDHRGFATEQRERLLHSVATVGDALPPRETWMLHLANSCGTWLGEDFQMDMIRPGLALSGYGPDVMKPAVEVSAADALQPPLSWWSQVNHVQRYEAGVRVGYGQTFELAASATLAVVPVGYADGYRLAWSGRSCVRLFDRETGQMLGESPVRGRVNMDQIVIDVTDVAKQVNESAVREASVEVISDDADAPNSMRQLAKLADTHIYEVQSGLAAGLSRVWI